MLHVGVRRERRHRGQGIVTRRLEYTGLIRNSRDKERVVAKEGMSPLTYLAWGKLHYMVQIWFNVLMGS
jgi:ribosomal protein S19E (S16A)